MLYLMAEIWIYLLIAALFGGLSAWLITNGRSLDRVDRAEGSWKTRIKASEEEWAQKLKGADARLRRELEERERHTTALTQQLQGERQRSGGLNDKLAEEAASYQSIKDELEVTKTKLRMLDDRLSIALEVGDKAEVALRRGTAEFESKMASLRQEAEQASGANDEARAQLKAARESRVDLEKQLADARAGLAEAASATGGDGDGGDPAATSVLRARIRDLEGQVKTLEGQLAKDVEELDRLQATMEARAKRVKELEPMATRVRELEYQVTVTEKELARREQEIAEYEARPALAAGSDEGQNGQAQDTGSNEGMDLKFAAAVRDLPDLDALLARSPGTSPTGGLGPGMKQNGVSVGAETEADDLRKIRGIGPVLQRKLKQLGYRTFHQIADWTEKDIERVCETLPIFPDRIRREDWVAQARVLGADQHDA